MNDAMTMDGTNFEAVLTDAMTRRRAMFEAPAGLEQRLKARLAQQDERPHVFEFAESVRTERSAAALWTALLAHAGALVLVLMVVSVHHQGALKPPGSVLLKEQLMLLQPQLHVAGGGGGAKDMAPVTKGELPKIAKSQIVLPKAPPLAPPKLAIEPTVVAQDLKMAETSMPNLGVPNAPAAMAGSFGNGSGGGIGSGNGNGIGPGSGGNVGGGVYRIGGGVRAPVVITQVDPEYSDEARKAHFTGNVIVSLVVDERGLPTHVQVVHGAGLGLDEKAIEAVRQYRFRPATKDGKPVKVAMNVDVNFEIF